MNYSRNEIKLSFFGEPELHVNKNKGTVVCILRAEVKIPKIWGYSQMSMIDENFITTVGVAKCANGDVWDENRGKKIAIAKAENKAYLEAVRKIEKWKKNLEFLIRTIDKFTDKAFGCCAHNEDYISGLSFPEILNGSILLPNDSLSDKDSEVIVTPKHNIEFVDLGLPSGTKWMKCNIGATSETDYGLYFQWGDTVGYTGDEAKNHSTWDTAPFNNGSSGYDSTYWASVKSTVLDENNCLLPAYDAAYQATKGAAKMPTKEQIEELINNTTSAWVTTYNGVNVAGATFTANGNTLFVPAAGCYGSGSFSGEGSGLNCWGSSLDSSSENGAWYLYGGGEGAYCYDNGRYVGFSVRGVQC